MQLVDGIWVETQFNERREDKSAEARTSAHSDTHYEPHQYIPPARVLGSLLAGIFRFHCHVGWLAAASH